MNEILISLTIEEILISVNTDILRICLKWYQCGNKNNWNYNRTDCYYRLHGSHISLSVIIKYRTHKIMKHHFSYFILYLFEIDIYFKTDVKIKCGNTNNHNHNILKSYRSLYELQEKLTSRNRHSYCKQRISHKTKKSPPLPPLQPPQPSISSKYRTIKDILITIMTPIADQSVSTWTNRSWKHKNRVFFFYCCENIRNDWFKNVMTITNEENGDQSKFMVNSLHKADKGDEWKDQFKSMQKSAWNLF